MPVLYVMGAMRSGTTIAGQVLAASPAAMLIGEVKPMLREPERHRQCDCGRPVEQCPFWSTVLAGADGADLTRAATAAYSLRMLPHLVLSVLTGRALPPAARTVVDLLRTVAETAGDRVLVDTSKTPVGPLLWRLAGQPVHLVTCVRAPWEVAAAQARPTAQTGLPPVARPVSWVVWGVYLAVGAALGPLATSRSLIRYRDLRRAPWRSAGRVWRRTGLPAATTTDPREFRYGESHVLAANPRRSQGGRVRVEPLTARR